MEPKKQTKQEPLADSLRAALSRTEAQHAQIFAHDEPKAPIGNAVHTFTGRRWSEEILRGEAAGAGSTARSAVKGMWSICAREVGGCGGVGHSGGHGFYGEAERAQCQLCGGAGRFPSEAGAELLRFVLQALNLDPKPDATPEAIAEHNVRVVAARDAREAQQAAQNERAEAERRILGEAQSKLNALRGDAHEDAPR